MRKAQSGDLREHSGIYQVKSTTPGCEDADGKFRPKVEQCCRKRNADGNSVFLVHLPRCQYKHATNAEQEDTRGSEIQQGPVHFTSKLHGQ